MRRVPVLCHPLARWYCLIFIPARIYLRICRWLVRCGAAPLSFILKQVTEQMNMLAFADQILALMAEHAGQNNRLAVDKIENAGYAALANKGVALLMVRC